MTERPDGWYWTNFRGEVAPRRICNGLVIVGVVPFKESEVDEIGPPCNRDDAEQLAKARDVLRKIRQLAETHEFVDDWVFREIIDESGVRL